MMENITCPSLSDWATFIDSVKNVLFALTFVLIGFYVTINPDIMKEFASRWVDAAMIVASYYIGTRSSKVSKA